MAIVVPVPGERGRGTAVQAGRVGDLTAVGPFRRASAAAAAATLCVLAACARVEAGSPPDLLLVTVDTLRHDYVSAYGALEGTTPAMDALGRAGAVFERHHAVVSVTGPAHTSLFTGLYPRQHGLRHNGHSVDEGLPWLPRILAERGYRTVGVVSCGILSAELGFGAGFESFDDGLLLQERSYERTADESVEVALAALQDDDPRPLFLWVHLFDPHDPHEAPEPYVELSQAADEHLPVPLETDAYLDRDGALALRTGYEAEVRFVDAKIGQLLAAWDARRRGREGLVVLTADHGEGLGEHGDPGHGLHIYQEQLQIPLLLRHPARVPAGTRVSARTSAIDLPRTMLDLLGVTTSERLGGRSLTPMLKDGADRRLFAERRPFTDEEIQRGERLREAGAHPRLESRAGTSVGEKIVLVLDGWKYTWTEDGQDELYDLGHDPQEAENLVAVERERAAEMRRRVEAWRASHLPVRPTADGEQLQTEVETMLRALGY